MTSPSNRLTLEYVDHFLKVRLERMLKAGERPIMIGSFCDLFVDGELCLCDHCGKPIFVRPWMFKAVREHDLILVCMDCASLCVDPEEVVSQIENDIQTMERKRFGSMYG